MKYCPMNLVKITAAAFVIFAVPILLVAGGDQAANKDAAGAGTGTGTGSGTGAFAEPSDISPVALPENLPGGAVRKFHRAVSVREFPYSGSSRIIIYTYADPKTAGEDFDVLAKAAKSAYKPLDRSDSELLSEQGALVRDGGRSKSALFRIDAVAVEVVVESESVAMKDIIKSSEEILRMEKKRIAEMFSTIEKTFKTFIAAVEKKEKKTVAACVSSAYLEKEPKYVDKFFEILNSLEEYNSRFGGSISMYECKMKFLRGEEEAAGGWAIIVLEARNYFMKPSWMHALKLREGRDMRNATKKGYYYWIPFVKEGDSWKIDVSEIMDSDILEREAPDNIAVVANFMRAAALMQENFLARDLDGDNAADYAGSLEELENSSASGFKAALPSGTGYDLKLALAADGKSWSMAATPVKQPDKESAKESGKDSSGSDGSYEPQEQNQKNLYIDQTGIIRAEDGKPANAASPEFPEVSYVPATGSGSGSAPGSRHRRVITKMGANGAIIEEIIEMGE